MDLLASISLRAARVRNIAAASTLNDNIIITISLQACMPSHAGLRGVLPEETKAGIIKQGITVGDKWQIGFLAYCKSRRVF